MPRYLVTTRLDTLQQHDGPFAMVDGTVPGWAASARDLHFDHHRSGGAEVQIDEMPALAGAPLISDEFCIVTTALDADACVAAACLQLRTDEVSADSHRRLRAIAYDCDHLGVPVELADLGDFAAAAVAALQLSGQALITGLGLPADKRKWDLDKRERFAAVGFAAGTAALLAAVRGQASWPGANGEANDYLQTIDRSAAELLQAGCVQLIHGVPLFDLLALADRSVDPRCCLRALAQLGVPHRAETLTRRVWFEAGLSAGHVYTLGCVPADPRARQLDYTLGTYRELSVQEGRMRGVAAELVQAQFGLPGFAQACGFNPWGGRRSVGGSGWNQASSLSPAQVIETVLATPHTV